MALLVLSLGLVVVGVVAWLVTVHSRVPTLAAWLAVVAVGWILYRFDWANRLGAVLLCISAAIILGLWLAASTPLEQQWVQIAQFVGTGASLLFFATGILFFIASIKVPKRCAGNCAGFMIVFFSVVIPAVSAYTIQSRRKTPEAVQETRQMLLTLHRLTAEIEAIHAKTGRYPANEAELVALRGKPMPQYHRTFRISYDRPGTDSYRKRGEYHLECSASRFWGKHWDLFGWIFHFYGPDATQRVYVETF